MGNTGSNPQRGHRRILSGGRWDPGFEAEGHDDRHRHAVTRIQVGRVCFHRPGVADEIRQGESEGMIRVRRSVREQGFKQGTSPAGVVGGTGGGIRAGFDAGCCQSDERLEEIGDPSPASGQVPQGFPRLVSLPVIAAIEQVDPAEVMQVGGPVCRIEFRCGSRGAPGLMGGRIAGRVGETAGHVGVVWERPRGEQSRLLRFGWKLLF